MKEVDPSVFLRIGRKMVGLINEEDEDDDKEEEEEEAKYLDDLRKELFQINSMIQYLDEKNKKIENSIKKSNNIFFINRKNIIEKRIEKQKYNYNKVTIEKLNVDRVIIENLILEKCILKNEC
jgi:small-conductance mechanosensitive channel